VEAPGVHEGSASVWLLGLLYNVRSTWNKEFVYRSSLSSCGFVVALDRFLKLIPSSASGNFSSAKFLLVIVGDGGLDAAGEKTPTPESFKLFTSDVK